MESCSEIRTKMSGGERVEKPTERRAQHTAARASLGGPTARPARAPPTCGHAHLN